MTRQERQNRIDALRHMLEETEAITPDEEAQSTPPHQRWKPELWEDYFYCSYSGSVYKVLWTNGKLDNGMYNIGNVFRTEKETEFEAERLKVLAEMREWAGKWNDEFTLRYDENRGIETYNHVFPLKSYGEMRFATGEDAENCIKTVGADRIKKYYFMISEDKA